MCHLVREPKAVVGDSAGTSVPPTSTTGLRPRWAGAIAAVFLGGVALAAWVAPPTATPKAPEPVKPTVSATVPAAFVATPTATDVEHGMLPADDDVPTAGARAASGGCHHAL